MKPFHLQDSLCAIPKSCRFHGGARSRAAYLTSAGKTGLPSPRGRIGDPPRVGHLPLTGSTTVGAKTETCPRLSGKRSHFVARTSLYPKMAAQMNLLRPQDPWRRNPQCRRNRGGASSRTAHCDSTRSMEPRPYADSLGTLRTSLTCR